MRARFRPNFAALGVALVAMALLLNCGVASAQEAPDGWAVFSSQTPDDVTLFCANHSREWKVSLDSEKVVISEGRDHSGMSRIEYGTGKLEGLDHGEFGGGLWWLDGASKTKLSDENVHGFVRTQFGTLAFVGLVTRLTPKGSSYEEDWLVPSDCLRFVDLGYRCVCGGMPKELLIERLTVAEAEARLKPFAPFTRKAWENLRQQMQPGDELSTWRHEPHAGGEVVASFNARINSSSRF